MTDDRHVRNHAVRWTLEPGYEWPRDHIECHNEFPALCRMDCAEGCEIVVLGEPGADGSLRDEDGHAIVPSATCNAVEWISSGDGLAAYWAGFDLPNRPPVEVASGPVEVFWGGDAWLWDYIEATA